jgi:hypothetical protein
MSEITAKDIRDAWHSVRTWPFTNGRWEWNVPIIERNPRIDSMGDQIAAPEGSPFVRFLLQRNYRDRVERVVGVYGEIKVYVCTEKMRKRSSWITCLPSR